MCRLKQNDVQNLIQKGEYYGFSVIRRRLYCNDYWYGNSFCMHLNGKVLQVLNKFFPEEIPVEKKPVQKSDNNEEIALAIACAMAAAGKKQTA